MLTSAGLEGNLHKLELLNRLDLKTKPCQRFRDHLYIVISSNNIEIEKKTITCILCNIAKNGKYLTNYQHIARIVKKILKM